jgi:hypothetical protein
MVKITSECLTGFLQGWSHKKGVNPIALICTFLKEYAHFASVYEIRENQIDLIADQLKKEVTDSWAVYAELLLAVFRYCPTKHQNTLARLCRSQTTIHNLLFKFEHY